MDEEQLPQENQQAFIEFEKWKNFGVDADLGEMQEDWEPWWVCFLAGWRSCMETLGAR